MLGLQWGRVGLFSGRRGRLIGCAAVHSSGTLLSVVLLLSEVLQSVMLSIVLLSVCDAVDLSIINVVCLKMWDSHHAATPTVGAGSVDISHIG